MDKFTNTIGSCWDITLPYNNNTPSLNEHNHHHDYQTQWPMCYPPIFIQNSTNEPSNSSSSTSHHLLPSSQNYFLICTNNNQATDDDHDRSAGLARDEDSHHLRSQEIGDEPKEEEDEEELGAMKEMMFKIAAMQPVDIDPATVRKPRRRNVRISDDPQSVAARLRRERISEKIRILQRLVPGGTKMDTASMLDEAIRYVKFLKRQTRILTATVAENPAAPYLSGGGNYNNDMTGEHNNPMFFNQN